VVHIQTCDLVVSLSPLHLRKLAERAVVLVVFADYVNEVCMRERKKRVYICSRSTHIHTHTHTPECVFGVPTFACVACFRLCALEISLRRFVNFLFARNHHFGALAAYKYTCEQYVTSSQHIHIHIRIHKSMHTHTHLSV
jgi:hypothetical protein